MNRHVVTLVLVTFSLLQLSVAHKCADGSRIRCMPVTAQSIQNAPRANGGKSASGSLFCTPNGEKVYCLKEHSYHQCAQGEEPCCQDGTNPSHFGNYHSDSSDTQCSTETSPVTTEEPVQPAAQAQVQIVLDDMEQKSESLMTNTFEGTFEPCMRDAWKGQFHHDWASNKGSASYTFKVNVPVSGCYKIEEYHPGSSESCSQYLPNNAQLDVKYCKDKSKTIWVNQAADAAQWNEIDSLTFYEGMEGELTMRSHKLEECRALSHSQACFWVVDAFRLTWTGEACGKQEPEPEPEPMAASTYTVTASQTALEVVIATTTSQIAVREGPMTTPEVVITTMHIAGQEETLTVPKVVTPTTSTTTMQIAWEEGTLTFPEVFTTTMQIAGREGTLMLQAGLNGGNVQLKLAEHRGVLEIVLAAHLGRKNVQVRGIWKQGRRLHGGDAHMEHLKIKFVASNAITESSSPVDLRQALQDAFDKVLVGMAFQSASVSWGWEPWSESKDTMTAEEDQTRSLQIVAYIIVGAATLVALLLGLGLCVCCRARTRDANNDSSKKTIAPEDAVYDLESTSNEKKENKEKSGEAEDIDVEVASVSTGTPGSDDDNTEGSRTVTPSNSIRQEPDLVVTGQVVYDL